MAETIGKNFAPFNWAQVQWILQWPNGNPEESKNSPDRDLKIIGVTTDSRAVKPGNLFIALTGEKFDGHNYLQQVKEQGAVAAVVERQVDVDLPQFVVEDTVEALGKLARVHQQIAEIHHVIGITGSYGKTSTRALLFAALSPKFKTLSSQANFNNEIGVPLTLLQLDRYVHQAAVLEMGMRGRGQIDYLAKIAEPTIGVITNVGPQHVELLGSVEEIALAKAELLENLPEHGLAVLPADSPFLELLKSKCRCRIITFGIHEGANYRVVEAQISPEGWVEFSVEFTTESWPVTTESWPVTTESWPVTLRLPGIHNAINATAAFAVAHHLGVEPTDIALALESAEIPGARMRVVKLQNGVTLIDDCYNAGPDSMHAALQTLLDFPGSGRRVAVLGDMKELGDFSEPEHQKIGTFAGQFVELLIGVGGETRPLLNSAIQAAREVENEMEVHWYSTAQEARQEISGFIRENDVILVKGSRSVGLEAVVEGLKI